MRFFLLTLFFFIVGNTVLWAVDTPLNKPQKLHNLQSHIKDVHQSIQKIDHRRDDVSKQLRDLEKKYGNAAHSLQNLSQGIDKKWRRLKEISKELKRRRQKLKEENSKLNAQIKSTFIMGKKEKLKLLLNQQDAKLASRMMMYYHYLNKARLTRITAIKDHIEVLTHLKQEKKQESTQLRKKSSVKKIQQKKLVESRNQRQVLLLKLNKDLSSKNKQLTQLKHNEKQLQQLIVSLGTQKPKIGTRTDQTQRIKPSTSRLIENSPFLERQGKLPWPIKGKIIKKFNSKRSDSRWDGMLLFAKEGTKIQAIAKGRVVYADWLRGYGLLVIIDHGANYMSLYAFNQSLDQAVGDQVKMGTVIATVGKSGGREQVGLYFGIRYQGKAVNPSHWCQKIQNGYVG